MAADENLKVYQTSSPCTKEFSYVRCTLGDDSRGVVFVDTPPFPHPYEGTWTLSEEQRIGNGISQLLEDAWAISSWILCRNDLPTSHISSSSITLPTEVPEDLSKYLAFSISTISATTAWSNHSPTMKYIENSAGKSIQREWPSCWLSARMYNRD